MKLGKFTWDGDSKESDQKIEEAKYYYVDRHDEKDFVPEIQFFNLKIKLNSFEHSNYGKKRGRNVNFAKFFLKVKVKPFSLAEWTGSKIKINIYLVKLHEDGLT